MKYQPLKHRTLWLVVFIIGLIILLGLLSGAGYVLVVWLGWQVQTSATVFMLLLFAVILGVAYAIRSINHWIKNWHLRHPKKIEHYRQLLPFEQLGCLWLLDAKTSKQQEIEEIFNQSASLRQLVRAHLLRKNAQLEQAAEALEQGSALADLLALENIGLLIAGQQYTEAVQALTVLNQQPLSSFAQSLNPAWDNAIQELWARLATVQPWLMLDIDTPPALTPEQYHGWLAALQQQLAQATHEQLQRVINYYQDAQTQPLFWQDIASARQWLFVLNRISNDELVMGQQALEQQTFNQQANNQQDMQQSGINGQGMEKQSSGQQNVVQQSLIEQRQQLADQLLRLEFDPRILTIWLQNQLQQGNVDCQHFTQRLNELAQRYPGQPSIALAQWHQLKADQQNEAAQDILQNWQHHPEFSYLRLKQALADQPQQLADLDIIYEHLKR